MPTKKPAAREREQRATNRRADTKAAGMRSPAAQANERRAGKAPPMSMIASGKGSDILPSFTKASPFYTVVHGRRILQNPDPIVREESGGLRTHVYEEAFEKDGHIGGVIDTRLTAATTLPRSIQPGNDSPEAARIAATVQIAFDRWNTFSRDAANLLYCVVRGFAIAETEYVVHPDGIVGIKRLHDCDPDAFVFDVDWNLRMLTQGEPLGGVELPPRKFIWTAHKPRHHNPYGVGIGRALWWLSFLKKRGLISWLISVEKYGVPTLVFKHPQGLSQTKRKELVDKGAKLQTDTVLAITDDIDVDTLKAVISAAGGGQQALEEFLNDEASKRTLGQTMTTDAKPSGLGSGAATAQSMVRQDLLEYDSDLIDVAMTDGPVRWLTEFNYGVGLPFELYPYMQSNAAPPDDTEKLSIRDDRLVRMGLRVPKYYFYTRYGIPEPQDGDEVINDDLTAQEKATMPQGLDPSGKELPEDDDELEDDE